MKRPAIDGLAQEVTNRAGRLDSPQEAAAVLESMGYTDEAARELRRANVFHLSDDIYARQYRDGAARDAVNAVEGSLRTERLRRNMPEPVGRLLPRALVRGVVMVLPAALVDVTLLHEAGAILAAAGMLLAVLGLQLVAMRLAQMLDSLPHRWSLAKTHELTERARAWYWQAVRSVIAASVAGAAIVFTAALTAGRHVAPFAPGLTARTLVFAVAAPTYALVLWSLLNAIVAFGFSRPWPVVATAVSATVANLAVGFTMSRAHVTWAAVVGSAAVTALWLLSTRATLRTLRKADYHLYATAFREPRSGAPVPGTGGRHPLTWGP